MVARKIAGSWDDLRFFLAVARTGTLSAAALQTGTEHTTVGRRIRALEGVLDARLFHRSNLGYALTEAGENLLAAAEGMESAFLSASAAAEAAHTVSGTVRIGAPDGFGSVFLAPRMHRLTGRHPGLEVEIMATARIFSLSKREADIVVSLSPPQQAGWWRAASPITGSSSTAPRATWRNTRRSARPATSKAIPSSATSRTCCSPAS